MGTETDTTAPVMVAIADIKIDGMQVREALDEDTVQRYAELMAEGVKFPPVIVYRDADGVLWLAAGFHRRAAALRNGATEILAEIWVGTRREAILKGIESNARHGLPYSNADKRRAVEVLLGDDEWQQWSDRAIARQVGVANSFVSKVRNALSVLREQIREKAAAASRTVTRGGRTYEMETAQIGKRGVPTAAVVKKAVEKRRKPAAMPVTKTTNGAAPVAVPAPQAPPEALSTEDVAASYPPVDLDEDFLEFIETLEAIRGPLNSGDFTVPMIGRFLAAVQAIDESQFFLLIHMAISSFGPNHHLGTIYSLVKELDYESLNCFERYAVALMCRRLDEAKLAPEPSR
jgi:ParB-like chromosome segregation protein Spo0J